MKIKRVVNGQEMEFELTGMELIEAFWEQEKYNTREDLEEVIQDNFDDDIELSESEFEIVTQLYKKYRSNSDEWVYDAESAINVVLQERGNK